MSYEGYTEYLCKRGHRTEVDCYDRTLRKCSCGHALTHYHSVDQTNGYEPDNPHTYPAPVREIGWDDVWHVDHYENRYATKNVRYEPDSKEWRST